MAKRSVLLVLMFLSMFLVSESFGSYDASSMSLSHLGGLDAGDTKALKISCYSDKSYQVQRIEMKMRDYDSEFVVPDKERQTEIMLNLQRDKTRDGDLVLTFEKNKNDPIPHTINIKNKSKKKRIHTYSLHLPDSKLISTNAVIYPEQMHTYRPDKRLEGTLRLYIHD
jgi:hypothetical protein